MDKIAILDRTIPLRDFNKENLNKVLLMDFMPYLTRLLSLTDETSAERLEIALPAIKEQCIGMGFVEIRKMFEYYVDSKLNLKPIPNYFDRILLGKIITEWKLLQSKKIKPKMKEVNYSESEKHTINNGILNRFLKKYEKDRFIEDELFYIYDILDKRKLTNSSLEYKNSIKKDAIYLLEQEINNKKATNIDEQRKFKKDLELIKTGKFLDIKRKCKILALEEFFRNLYKDQEKVNAFKKSL